ncbi:pentapeptide repeat-containing protein [Streptomyces kebangsaanensis]|uniref:pentapeptide repeat-containing protein n=1 Tax=Streptomyces kebangsaanensis TaxID=864058 RepID=UPI00093D46D1|nr:pentapeptide repeat-containing protein [Streptomyces kebangsaanensis]
MGVPTFRRRTELRGLRLWPVGRVLVLAFTAAVLVAAAVFYTGWDLLGARGLKPEHRIDSKTLFDLVKLSFGVVAGAGALVALIVAYRRQRVDEDGALREATRLHTERFTTAVGQLGDDSAAVRLGGVHALAGLADDAPTRALRQTCIDVLCAYLRLPYTAEAALPTGDAAARHTYLALREVRHTVIRLIRDHLRLPLRHPHSWQGHDFDLTNITFDGGDFSSASFSGGTVDFTGAIFSGGTVDFNWACFSGGTVDFTGAIFSGGTVDFNRARFSSGTVDFNRAIFSGGTVDFNRARFSGGTVDFNRAIFSGSAVGFGGATFGYGTVGFTGATFSGGTVDFGSWGIDQSIIARAEFCGSTVDFDGATFSGSMVDFDGATFSYGTVNFAAASFFGGTVDFAATFSGGEIRFVGATFSGGTVDFRQATGTAPSGLVPPTGSARPTGLLLPSVWSA